MYKRIVSLSLIGVILFSVASPALAQTWYSGNVLGESDRVEVDSTNTQSDRETTPTVRSNSFDDIVEQRDLTKDDRQTAIDEMKELKKEDRCTIVQDNLEKRTDYYVNSHTTHLDRYQGLVKSITNSSARLAELGYDTTALDLKIAEIEVLIADLNAQQDSLTANMVSAKNKACDEDAGEFKTELKNSLSGLKEIKSSLITLSKSLKEEVVDILLEMKEAGVKKETEEVVEETTTEVTQ